VEQIAAQPGTKVFHLNCKKINNIPSFPIVALNGLELLDRELIPWLPCRFSVNI
jgi:hypothetical protein